MRIVNTCSIDGMDLADKGRGSEERTRQPLLSQQNYPINKKPLSNTQILIIQTPYFKKFFKNKKGVNMVTGIILIWILIKLQAPTLLFWLAGMEITWSVFKILLIVYKTGKES